MQYNDGRIVALPPHGSLTQDSHSTEPGGGRQRRGTRDIGGVLPTSVEFSGVSSRGVTGEDTQHRKTQRKIYVPALEVKNMNPTGGPYTSPTVRLLWDAHDGSVPVETQEDGQM